MLHLIPVHGCSFLEILKIIDIFLLHFNDFKQQLFFFCDSGDCIPVPRKKHRDITLWIESL